MVGLIIAIIVAIVMASIGKKVLTFNQVIHITLFTTAFQSVFDVMVEYSSYGYWYFGKKADWQGVLPHILLIPAVNIFFLNRILTIVKTIRKIVFFLLFYIAILLYELVTLLPEPWGYFHYGWWNFWYSVIIDPFLLLSLLMFYKLTCYAERRIKEK